MDVHLRQQGGCHAYTCPSSWWKTYH